MTWINPNKCKYLPKEAVTYSNLLCMKCPICTNPRMSSIHLFDKHGIMVPDIINLIDIAQVHLESATLKGINRSTKKSFTTKLFIYYLSFLRNSIRRN